MSKILPVILLVGGLYYFSTTVSGESPVQGCMDETATNYDPDATEDDSSCKYENGNGNGGGGDDDDVISPIPGCPPVGGNKVWVKEQGHLLKVGTSDALNDIHIYDVTTNQENYYPGTQVDIEWAAKVKNKSKTRCGENVLNANKTCWFAPTNGSAIGDYEGPLNWTVYLIKPDGTQYQSKTGSGSEFFQAYTDSNISVDAGCSDKSCLSDLKDTRAKYQIAFDLGADAPIGQYSIRFHAPYGDDGNFATWTQISAFEVLSSDCNPEGFSAESTKINYETRFASNHDFMLY